MRGGRFQEAMLILLAVAVAMTGSGCFGSFKATKAVYELNDDISGPVLKEVVFLVFVIFPVYGLAMLIDALFLNIVEFASGEGPLS